MNILQITFSRIFLEKLFEKKFFNLQIRNDNFFIYKILIKTKDLN